MKVLQIINSLGAGGAEKLVVEISLLYNELGLEIDVLLLDATKTPLYNRLEKNENIKIHTVGNSKTIYNPFNIFKIRTYLKNYDLVHAHLFPVSYWVAMATLINFKKTPIIFTEHNTTNRRRSLFVFKIVDYFIYKQFEHIVTISAAVDNGLKGHLGSNFNNLTKIHNGINLDSITTAKPYNKEELNFKVSDKLLIQVASFTAQKDQNTLINAMKLLPKEIKLLLVGDGPLIEDSKKLVAAEQLEDRVCFLGIRDDVPRLLKSVDITVLSSHYEGLSLSSIEGMASGKPFIATDAPGLTEVVKDAGILFKIGDDVKLAKIILELLTDAAYYKSISKSCLQKAKEFDINNMVNKYINLYERVVKANKKHLN